MRHKVAELEGALLDAAVALAEGNAWRFEQVNGETLCCTQAGSGAYTMWCGFEPSVAWSQGGRIIQREAIALQPDEPLISTEVQRAAGMAPVAWTAWQWRDPNRRMMRGATPLVAAMRLRVASKFGDEVDLP
jgi:hypothetical protein